MAKSAFECVGFTPKRKKLAVNCGNCENWKKRKCTVRDILDELYAESQKFKAFDRMMRTNKGVRIE